MRPDSTDSVSTGNSATRGSSRKTALSFAALAVVTGAILSALPARAQSREKFEVASVKPGVSGGNPTFGSSLGRFHTLVPSLSEFANRSSQTREFSQASEPSGLPGLGAALREQLGLKLKSSKGQVEVIVIDAIARPSPD